MGQLGIEIYYTIGISVKHDICFDPDGFSWENSFLACRYGFLHH